MATQYRLPVYKKIQGKGWEEVREEPVDPQAQLRYLAIMNEWMTRKYPYSYLQFQAEELQKQQRDTNAEVNIPDPGVQAEKEARSDGDQIIKEIMKKLGESIAVNQCPTALCRRICSRRQSNKIF